MSNAICMSKADDYLIKGRVFKGYAKYIRKKWGIGGIAEANKKVGADIEGFPDEKWVTNTYMDNLMDWICETHGPEEMRKAGFAIVKERGIVSYVARIAGFERIMDRGVDEIKDSLKFGEVKITKAKEGKKAELFLKDVVGTPSSCHAWQGILEGTMALTNTKGKVTKTKCQHKGDEACVYLMEW